MACGPVLRGGYGEWVSENDVFQSSSTFSQTADQKKLYEAIAVAMHAWLATLHRHRQVRLRHIYCLDAASKRGDRSDLCLWY